MIKMTHPCSSIACAILVNVGLVTNIDKSLKILFDTNLTQQFCTRHTLSLMDNLMDNSNMAMLRIKPRK